EEVLTVPGLIFQINTLGGAISSDVEGVYRIALSPTWASLRHTGNRHRTRRSFERRSVGCAIISRKPVSQTITQTIPMLLLKTGQRRITAQKIMRASSN